MSPGHAILLKGVTQTANLEIGVPGFHPIRHGALLLIQ